MQNRGLIDGYILVSALHSDYYGTATYIRNDIADYEVINEVVKNGVFIIAVKIHDTTIVNIYKPPIYDWDTQPFSIFPSPCIYVGDFNSHNTIWGYNKNDTNGISLMNWMTDNNYSLIFDAKDKKSFHSKVHIHNTDTNPDLCFVSENLSKNGIVNLKL